MAQLHRPSHADTSKASASNMATVEQLLRGGESSKVSASSSLDRWKQSEAEEEQIQGQHQNQNQKKSVLTKVKEKAKKLRHTLSGKKKHDDANLTLTFADDEPDDEDTEYLGAPMYESELAPEAYKEKARQHPRTSPVISEKHVLPSSVKSGIEIRDNKETPFSPSKSKRITSQSQNNPAAAIKTISEYTVSPSSLNSKFNGLSVSKPTDLHISSASTTTTTTSSRKSSSALSSPSTPRSKTSSQTFYDAFMPPCTNSAPVTPGSSSSFSAHSGSNMNNSSNPNTQIWDKGVSVREYFMNKFEPGEDERALSQVISEVMSPRRTPQEKGVVEKVKDAVTSLLRNGDPSQNADQASATTITTTNSSEIPLSTNAYEVGQEESQGRILQAN